MYPREDMTSPALDRWIARAFARQRPTAGLTALTHAADASAAAAGSHAPEVEQGGRAGRLAGEECEKHLSHCRAALAAGGRPAVVTPWIDEARVCAVNPPCPVGGQAGEGNGRQGRSAGSVAGVVVAGRKESSGGSLVGCLPSLFFR